MNIVDKAFDVVANGDLEELQRILKHSPEMGTKVRRLDHDLDVSRTLLLQAAQHSRWHIFKYILTLSMAGSALHLNARDRSCMTALLYAAQRGPLDVIRKLLQKKNLDSHVTDLYGRSALFLAATCGDRHVVLELLNRRAYSDVDEVTVWGSTALTAASECGDRPDVLRYLLRAGADFEFKEQDTFKTALDLATEKGWIENVLVLEDAERAYVLHKLRTLRRLRPSSTTATASKGSGRGEERPAVVPAFLLRSRGMDDSSSVKLPSVQVKPAKKRCMESEVREETVKHVLDKMDTKAFEELLAMISP